MGLLQYKAHCTNVYGDEDYAIATKSEMIDFLCNLDVHMVISHINGQYFDVMLEFQPFPVKYLNYVKRYNYQKGQGHPHKYDNQRMVFAQIFRITQRCGTEDTSDIRFIPDAYDKVVNHGYDAGNALPYLWNDGKNCPLECKSYTFSPGKLDSRRLYRPATPFKHILTPATAAKGRMMLMQRVHIVDSVSARNSCIIDDGAYYYNFHHGFAAGISMCGGSAICGSEDTLTYKRAHEMGLIS